MGKAALAVRSFFGKNVALESVFALDLTSARELESLLGAGFGLHLRPVSYTHLTLPTICSV